MPIFEYVAKDQAGKIHRGHAEAADEKALIKQLGSEGLWLTQAALSSLGDTNSSPLPSDNTKAKSSNSDDVKKAKLLGGVAMVLILMAIALLVFPR